PEEIEARRMILEAALRRLEKIRDRDAQRFADVYDDVAQHYSTRLRALTGEGSDEHGTTADHAQKFDDVSRDLMTLEREIAVDLRQKGRISDDVLRRILHELDLTDARRAAAET